MYEIRGSTCSVIWTNSQVEAAALSSFVIAHGLMVFRALTSLKIHKILRQWVSMGITTACYYKLVKTSLKPDAILQWKLN